MQREVYWTLEPEGLQLHGISYIFPNFLKQSKTPESKNKGARIYVFHCKPGFSYAFSSYA